MACNGKCGAFKATKPYGMGRYESGQSRCTECELYINYEGRFCPCCQGRLRKSPRSLKYKEQLRQRRALKIE